MYMLEEGHSQSLQLKEAVAKELDRELIEQARWWHSTSYSDPAFT